MYKLGGYNTSYVFMWRSLVEQSEELHLNYYANILVRKGSLMNDVVERTSHSLSNT